MTLRFFFIMFLFFHFPTNGQVSECYVSLNKYVQETNDESVLQAEVHNLTKKYLSGYCDKMGDAQEVLAIKNMILKLETEQSLCEFLCHRFLLERGYSVKLFSDNNGNYISLISASNLVTIKKYLFEEINENYIPVFYEIERNIDLSNLFLVEEANYNGRCFENFDSFFDTKSTIDTIKLRYDSTYLLLEYDKNYYEYQKLIWYILPYSERIDLPFDSILKNSIKKYFTKETSSETIAFCLKFCQNKIKYLRDNSYYDSWAHPIKTLVQSKGDCEDKALLFSTLLSLLIEDEVYLLLFYDQDGKGVHCNSAYGNCRLVTDCSMSDLTICEPSGEGYPVGYYDEKNKGFPVLLKRINISRFYTCRSR